MASISLIIWHRKAMDKETVKAMATKFSEIFAISMFKKHKRCGLTHLNTTPTFKKCPNTYETPCTLTQKLLSNEYLDPHE